MLSLKLITKESNNRQRIKFSKNLDYLETNI